MPRRRTRPSVPWASTAVAALLNFSRPGNQVIGQYYNFLRLGRAGHTQVVGCLSSTARWLAEELRKGKHFEVISDGSAIPVVCLWLAGNFGYTEFDVFHALRSYGWQVPAYTMPADATDVAVLRRGARRVLRRPGPVTTRRHDIGAGQSGRPQARRPLQQRAAPDKNYWRNQQKTPADGRGHL